MGAIALALAAGGAYPVVVIALAVFAVYHLVVAAIIQGIHEARTDN